MRYWKAGMLMDVVGHKGTPVEMPPDRVEVRDGSNRTAVTRVASAVHNLLLSCPFIRPRSR